MKALYKVQEAVSREYLKGFTGKTLRVLCEGIDYEKSCFVGRAYFQAAEIDGCVYFTADKATEGEFYDVSIEKTDTYDLYGVKV